MHAGARAFLQKTASLDTLAEAIKTVLEGKTVEPQWNAGPAGTRLDSAMVDLTSRQLEILAMLCQGLSNKEISLRMSLALITVKMHVTVIFRELGVVNRTQAALVARSLGLARVGEFGSL